MPTRSMIRFLIGVPGVGPVAGATPTSPLDRGNDSHDPRPVRRDPIGRPMVERMPYFVFLAKLQDPEQEVL